VTSVCNGRMTADVDGEFVVFLIGFRINKPWMVHKWLPVLLAMPRMLNELSADPSSGLMGYTMPPIPTVIVQYWRSFEQLEAYARSKDHEHWPAWVAFNRRVGTARGAVGIWHETYRVSPGQWETIYSGMPATGLGKATSIVPVTASRERARKRLHHQEQVRADTSVAPASARGSGGSHD